MIKIAMFNLNITIPNFFVLNSNTNVKESQSYSTQLKKNLRQKTTIFKLQAWAENSGRP